jgi:arabinofuranosyltransferase
MAEKTKRGPRSKSAPVQMPVQDAQTIKLLFGQPLSPGYTRIAGAAVVFSAAACALIFLAIAWAKNGLWCFPLDDPWIHLCFARNLAEFGSFSYFRDQLVTSGSTSPAYTFLLAAFYMFYNNEFIISYSIGIVCACLTAFAFWKLVRVDFKHDAWFATAAALIMALQPRIALIAVSGMETTMFIFFIIAALYFYRTANVRGLGIMLGLVLWCRPDGLILWVAVAMDYGLRRYANTKTPADGNEPSFTLKGLLAVFAIALAMGAAYSAFNFHLSGTLLPNTYSAKLAYYGAKSPLVFLQRDVLGYFFSRELLALSIFFIAGAGCVLVSVLRAGYSPYALYLIFVFGFVAAYCIKIPFGHRFGRYLMPIIPCYIALSILGLRAAARGAARTCRRVAAGNALCIACTALAVIAASIYISKDSKEYAFFCKQHNDRHVAAGRWIEANTPQQAIIATHDIGAIAFYGKRKVIDMLGLVTPELIPHIRQKKFEVFLEQYLAQKQVTHIVVLTNWFEIVNSSPLFVPVKEPDLIEVHSFIPAKTHIQLRAVSSRNRQAMQLAAGQNNYEASLQLLEDSYALDPKSSQTVLYLGMVNEMMGRADAAEQYYGRALALFPGYVDARFARARLHVRQGRIAEALDGAKKCLEISPEFAPAREMIAEITKQQIPQ